MDSFDYWQLLLRFRFHFLILLSGLILTGLGVFIIRNGIIEPQTKIEVLGGVQGSEVAGEITAEVSGAVIKPGVYKIKSGARIEDLLIRAGGFSAGADRVWTDKFLNRAAKITDGQKIFIPSINQQSGEISAKTGNRYQTVSPQISSDSTSIININTASLTELDSLPGIGQSYGQNIIEHRPYSTPEELVSKGVLRQSVFNRIKNLITVY